MRKIIKNFMPQDTRSLEILSGLSLFIISIIFFSVPDLDTLLFKNHPHSFWGLISGLAAVIQIYGIAVHPRKFRWRIIGLWLAGMFWTFFTLSGDFNPIRSISEIVLALSSFICFITNLIIASELKTKRV